MENNMIIGKKELDESGCSAPDCDHTDDDIIFLHPRCHPDSPTQVFYDKRIGLVCVACLECGSPVVAIRPAE
jgi:hypothetical protein